MKKIICMILFAALIMTALAGCGTPSTPPVSGDEPENSKSFEDLRDPALDRPSGDSAVSVTGIEAVKLLLAEERLNEKLLQNEGDIFESGAIVMENLIDRAIANLGVEIRVSDQEMAGMTDLSASSGELSGAALLDSIGTEKSDIGKMEVVGDKVVWSDLGEVSNSYEYFLNLTNNIVSEAEMCADLINFVKKYVRIVDKWVVFQENRYYLSVKENEELLCEETVSGDFRMLTVCRRYRNENGKDVYEMYRMSGESYEARMTYVPGEKYERSEGRKHHFIAENTKGYWENYVLGDEGTHYNTNYLIMKDDVCYTFGFAPDGNPAIDVLSADRQTDIFTVHLHEGGSSVMLKLNGFNNIEKITAPKSDTSFGPDDSYAYVDWKESIEIHIANGGVLKQNQSFCDGRVNVSGISVAAYGYGYGATMMINVAAEKDEVMNLVKEFLAETGLECSRDIDTVISGTYKAINDAKAVFNYYQWNGYTVNTEEGIRKATEVEKAKYDTVIGYYNEVKNAERVVLEGLDDSSAELHISFADIVGNESSGAEMTAGKLIIGSLKLTVNNTLLFVENEPYHVAIGLEDEGGALVHLEQLEPDEVVYGGEKEFSVTASDLEITLPRLSAGSYRVIAYIATSEGIRSSRFVSVEFQRADGVASSHGDVDYVGAVDGNGALTVTYTKRVDVMTALVSGEVLSYDAFVRLVCETAFKYGMPQEDTIEILRGEEYITLTVGEILGGEYRIAYTVDDGSSSYGGYVYITYTIDTETEVEE